jgi:mannose-6-phosphate isomerase-like protein (cupin superfamily)
MANMHFVPSGSGDTFDLGVVKMKLIASGEDTKGEFALAEWDGSEGPWTIPHLHRNTQESFYVLDGAFTFVCGDQEVVAEAGSYLLVPPGTPHVLRANTSRGRLLTVMVPGGLDGMFRELSRLPSDSLRDPATRAAVSARYDSIPV